jgi:peptidyl-prolyl cis-trans isomerase D
MYDFITNNKRLIQVILVIIFLPFAFFGVDQYFRGGVSGQEVARIGNYSISPEEYGRTLRDQQDALRQAVKGRVDPAVLDSPELRARALEALVQRRLLLEGALRAGLVVSDEQLRGIIATAREFQDESGRFSPQRYEQFLKFQGMTPAMFEARVRQDALLQQVADAHAGSTLVPRTVAERMARLAEERREVSHALIEAEKFVGRVKLEAGAARKYYDANPGEFRIPQQARVDYVVLATPALAQRVRVDPAEARQFYDANRRQYEVPESRQAAHIFFASEPGGGADAKEKVRARADEIYGQVRKNPAAFAELAKKHSQDPGSAARGGDLGFLPRGTMKDVPEFEDTLYKLEPGEISPPVQSKLGFHIIRLTAVQPAKGKSFEEVRGQIEADLRKQLATKRFAELADNFSNTAYEQSDSLKPAAELAGGPVRRSGWITREGAVEPELRNPKLLAAIFSEEALVDKRNTEAIEVEPGVLVAARVVEHKPGGTRPFDEVREAIEKRLALREAGRLAAEEGRRLLDALRQGKPAQVAWSPPQLAGLTETRGISEAVLRQAFRADPSRLPAYGGIENLLGGYTLVRVTRVQEAGKIPPEKVDAVAASLRQIIGQETMAAYIAALRREIGVRVNRDAIEKKSGER